PGTFPAPIGPPPHYGPERSGSTASSSATCAPRSAASATPASAAKAAPSAASSSPSPRPWSCRSERAGACALVLPGQYEDGDLPGDLGLMLAERGMPRDHRWPQLGAGGVVKLLRHRGERLGPHLDRDAGVGLEIVVPGRVLG